MPNLTGNLSGNPGTTAAQQAGLDAASPAPSATNPISTDQETGAVGNGSSTFTNIPSGTNAVILAAPPAGYYNIVRFIHAYNKSGAATAGMQVKEGTTGTPVILGGAATGIAAATSTSFPGQCVQAALTGFATGTGDLLVVVSYSRVPVSQIAISQVLLTSSYQTLVATPPAGVQYVRPLTGWMSTLGQCNTFNADNASCTPTFLLTRGSDALTNIQVAVAANAKGTQSLPDMAPGDTLQVKAAAAPNTAGSIVCTYMAQPLVTF